MSAYKEIDELERQIVQIMETRGSAERQQLGYVLFKAIGKIPSREWMLIMGRATTAEKMDYDRPTS